MSYTPTAGAAPEFQRVASAINSPIDGLLLRTQYKAPGRIPAGSCVILEADGVQLNPGGGGHGVYVFYSGGTFAKLS